MGTTTSKLTKILASKADAKAAINYKGVTCDDEFDKYGDRIREITTPIPPPPNPHTTSLIMPTSITATSEGNWGNLTQNTVLGNSQTALGWVNTTENKNDYTGTKIYYNGSNVKKIESGSSMGNDSSKRDLFLRVPYVNNCRTVGIQMNNASSLLLQITFPAPSDFDVSEDTKIEFYFEDFVGADSTSPSFWRGTLLHAYCRFTNEDIV